MNRAIEPRDRYNLRKALSLMERDIKLLKDTDTHVLNQSLGKRKHAGATAEYVDHEYNTSSTLLPSEWGWSIYLYLDAYIHKLLVKFPEVWQTWSCKQVGDYDFGDLYRTFDPKFGSLAIWHVLESSRPHIKCIMHNNLDSNDSYLLRGKVLTVIRIMLGQLKQKIFVNDMIAPVLLFSLNRRRPRVIEAYFDGQELVIRRTEPYDFQFLNTAGFKTFAQWFLSNPIGDTSKRAVRT
ncbi:hypothetical protein CBS63078_5852 [Aspergillus niger]|nr:hypothetical protein CBS12448_4380 [Aspergillus niger]KAI2894414.1 hypothetical protein CBS11852_4908 [Aspergillus niger]KAI2904021.1 hypothetical protein CBS63078_5852 [Aspergillus niger]KAI2918297.1 hypothetical protein CBS147371_4209 [Aspergillus niger]KAI2955010.1 hypothetical protein CBS147323_9802 [Aspergillus niger]